MDERILEFIGRKITPKPDYLYVLAILHKMGIFAKVDFLDTEGGSVRWGGEDEFVQTLGWSLGGLSEHESERAVEYFRTFISACPLFEPPPFRWAFISWEK